jgi:hypothetical protein
MTRPGNTEMNAQDSRAIGCDSACQRRFFGNTMGRWSEVQVIREYWIPAQDLTRLNENIERNN